MAEMKSLQDVNSEGKDLQLFRVRMRGIFEKIVADISLEMFEEMYETVLQGKQSRIRQLHKTWQATALEGMIKELDEIITEENIDDKLKEMARITEECQQDRDTVACSDSSWMYCRVLNWMSTDVSEVHAASIIRTMMEAAHTSETSVDIQLRTWQYIPEESELHTRRRENLKSHMVVSWFTQLRRRPPGNPSEHVRSLDMKEKIKRKNQFEAFVSDKEAKVEKLKREVLEGRIHVSQLENILDAQLSRLNFVYQREKHYQAELQGHFEQLIKQVR